MSYGSVVGQYMTSLLSPKRLNSVLLDGIVNITMWNTATDRTHPYSGLSSISAVLRSFARSCVEANHACALAHIGTEDDILASIISLVDSLYEQPLPALVAPGYMARARHARQALFSAQYSIKLWPMMSERLEQALRGNMTGLVELVRPKLSYNTWAEAARVSHGPSSRVQKLTIVIENSMVTRPERWQLWLSAAPMCQPKRLDRPSLTSPQTF